MLQLIANHVCSMISFPFWNHYVPVTTSTLSIFLVMFEIYSLSEQGAGTLSAHTQNKWMIRVLQIFRISFKPPFFVLCLKIWKLQESNGSICKSFYRLEIGSSSWCVKLPECQLINWLIVSMYQGKATDWKTVPSLVINVLLAGKYIAKW